MKKLSDPSNYSIWPQAWRDRYDKWGSIRPDDSDDHTEMVERDRKRDVIEQKQG